MQISEVLGCKEQIYTHTKTHFLELEHFVLSHKIDDHFVRFPCTSANAMMSTKMETRGPVSNSNDMSTNGVDAPSGFILKLWQMIDAEETDEVIKVSFRPVPCPGIC